MGGRDAGTTENANHRLVRFFCICLGTLVFAYALLALRLLFEGDGITATDGLLTLVRVSLGAAALAIIISPP